MLWPGPGVELLGVGTWAWGDRRYWGYGRDYSEADVEAAYAASRESGIDVFDTAEVYGRGESERLLGKFVRAAGDQDKVAVATKFAPFPWRSGRQGPLLNALQASLDRLGVARVDLYQLHFPLVVLSNQPFLADLAVAVERGLIGAVGVSNYGPGLLRTAHAELAGLGVLLATNQVKYSLLARRPERSGLVDVCRELDVRVIAYSPLAQGLLTGKYTAGQPPGGYRGLNARRHLKILPSLIERLSAIGAVHEGKTPAQVALNWLICKGAVPIPGAKNADQARDNAGALGWRLTPAEVAELDRA